jgi:hypothetical protein
MLDSERYISNAASEPISAFLPYIWPYIFMQRAATFSDVYFTIHEKRWEASRSHGYLSERWRLTEERFLKVAKIVVAVIR